MDKISKNNIKQFNQLLAQYPDDYKFGQKYREFFLKMKKVYPKNFPFMEAITVLKKDKPSTFYMLKKLSKGNMFLEYMLELETDYEEAKRLLGFNES